MRVWVNFKELRSQLQFEDVLRHYKVEVKRKGNQHQGFCPLPNHQGTMKSPSFSARLDVGIFQCFECGAKGNILDFACLMTGVDPRDGDALRSVAVELQRKFIPQGTGARKAPVKSNSPQAADTEVKVNVPLDFELKALDHSHPYLAGRGFELKVMQHFGVGFCSRGLLKDRVAIPLHDSDGKLVGYSGRVVDDAAITEENPRYKFPSRHERGGVIYEFRKSRFVYNGFRIRTPVDNLIVVEGFPSVWWLVQHGLPHSVALMGSSCSEEQREHILRLVHPKGQIWLMPDGNKAGERLALSFLPKLARDRFVRWASLEEDKQPTDLPKERLHAIVSM